MALFARTIRSAGTYAAALGFSAILFAAVPQPADPSAAILGEWRGTSICTDRVLAPNCNDEVVIYEFVTGAAPGKIKVKADKVVDGKRLPMGDLDVVYDAGTNTWSAEFRNERVHIMWTYTVQGEALTGTLIHLPSRAVVRKASARRADAR